MSDGDLIRYLGIQACGDFSAQDIAKAVRRTVAGFCFSGDDEIDANHLPGHYAHSFDNTIRQVILHHAAEFWKAIVSPPSRDFVPPVRGYHRIKWAALNQLQIPTRYTHVLIDECHDLTKPMLQILERSPQAVFSLGDEYQNLQGQPRRPSDIVRQREVTHSVRSGRAIEEIVNPIIAVHPGKTKAAFQGNPLQDLEIEYYDKPRIPERPATIVTNEIWGLFEWAQRVANERIAIARLCDLNELSMFVDDCIELYREGTRPRHGKLFRCRSWDDVTKVYHKNRSFRYIDAWLRNGYTYGNWQETRNRFVEPGPRAYSLGMIGDIRNREFDTVMVTPDFVDFAWGAKSEAIGAAGSAIYLAVTRATHRLIVPEALRHWVEEISATRQG